MPSPHTTMRKFRDVLRLRLGEGLSLRQTALSLSMALTTVAECVRRARAAGISWPVELDDGALERLLFDAPTPTRAAHFEPDFALVQRESRQ